MAGGRTYEFNPGGTDTSTQSRAKMRDATEKVAKQKDLPASAEEKISYGKRFAKTEELYQARLMEKELEELARQDGALDGGGAKKAASGASGAKKRQAAKAKKGAPAKMESLQSRHQVLEQVTRGAPIGAVPPAAEPPPRAAWSDVLGDAQRYLGMLKSGWRDMGTAGYRLARLPVEVAVLAMARLRPRHA